MFAFPNVFHLFAHKLACLSGRRETFPFVFACPFNCFVFWHDEIVSLRNNLLDVTPDKIDKLEISLVVTSALAAASASTTAAMC